MVGHLGEALPFWLSRLDYMHDATVRSQRYDVLKPLEHRVSDYMRRNVWFTTSGMASQPAILFVREVVGADRVLYAMDYPYQYAADEVRLQDALPLNIIERRAFFETIATDLFGLHISAAAT